MGNFLDRPGGTYDQIVNGYAVTMKECDDRCGGMHGGGCTCGAASYNSRVKKEAEGKPPKDPPDKLQPTYYQLTQRMAQASTMLGKIDFDCHTTCHSKLIALLAGECNCGGDGRRKAIKIVIEKLSLE